MHYISSLSKIQEVVVLLYSLSLDIWLSTLQVLLYRNSSMEFFDNIYAGFWVLSYFREIFMKEIYTSKKTYSVG